MSRSGSIHGRKALSLEERIARTRGRKPTPVDSGTAAGRAERWMQQFPFDDPEIFKRRLAVFNQLQHEFLRVCPGTSSRITKFSEHEAD
jgi:hypothetical protein